MRRSKHSKPFRSGDDSIERAKLMSLRRGVLAQQLHDELKAQVKEFNFTLQKSHDKVPAEVLDAVGQAWEDCDAQPGVIIATWLQQFPKEHVHFSSLAKPGVVAAVRKALGQGVAAARAYSSSMSLVSAADKECMSLVPVQVEIASAFDFGAQAVRGATGQLCMSPEAIAILRSRLGGIASWVRCLMSSNDPSVLEVWGSEAALELMRRLDLVNALQAMNADLAPIWRHKVHAE